MSDAVRITGPDVRRCQRGSICEAEECAADGHRRCRALAGDDEEENPRCEDPRPHYHVENPLGSAGVVYSPALCEAGPVQERAAIVTWLRSLAGPRYPDDLAGRIERGEHAERP